MENKGKRIIIAERDNIAAIMDGKKVSEFFIHRGEVLLGDVYLATVENILPSIDAAFVDVGVDKMGFLHAQDVMGKGALKDKLSPKQKLVVQVVKEPTGHKGPRVTTQLSLPGRFLVLMPNETGINVSRKIESVKEKARLKSVVNLLKPVGVGIIVRTEAEGQSEADIQEDLEILLEKWNNIVTSADTLTPPNLIYRDQDLLYRVIREACTDDVQEIIVDTSFAMNRVQQILQNWHMNKNIEVSVYKGNDPLLVATDVYKEIKAALQTKVHLPSGGYLYIQTTEALTVVDVNSGKFISSATQDETILRTNKEAVQEIARQLRLRNIGGMIIVDFIDMTSRVDKLAILEEFELALEPDKAKPQIGQLSDLGLVELTRHRQGQSLAEIFTKKCPHCSGAGYSMQDIAFASPTAEGEYRAKAAKLKLPVSNFKKNNNFNKRGNNNQPFQQQQQQQNIQPTEQADGAVEVQGEQQIQGENLPQQQRDNKKFNDRRDRFNRNKNRNRNRENFQPQTQESQDSQETQQISNAPVQVQQAPQAEQPTEFVKPQEQPIQEQIEKQAPVEKIESAEVKEEEKKPVKKRAPRKPAARKKTAEQEVKNEEVETVSE